MTNYIIPQKAEKISKSKKNIKNQKAKIPIEIKQG